MMTALATVSAVRENVQMFDIELSCDQQTSCSSCASQKSCATGIASKVAGKKALHWNLTTSRSVKVGQVVEIGFPEKSLIQSAAVVYLVPILALFIGALFAQWLIVPQFGLGEGCIILSAVLFSIAGIVIAKQLSKKLEHQSQQEVVLLRVLGEPIS